MKKEKKVMLIEKNLIEFKSQVYIYQESNMYFFQSSNPKLYNFSTFDYMEATAALMKLRQAYSMDKIWDIRITDDMRYNINVYNILYWLSGGDNTWKNSNIYKKSWDEYADIFVNHFKEVVLNINKGSKNIKECRDKFMRELSLPVIYEFSLENNLLQ